MRLVITTVILALTYLAVIGRWSLIDALTGLAVGLLIASVFGRFEAESPPLIHKRFLALPWFGIGVCSVLFRGSWMMLLVLLGIKTWRNVGFVEVPYGERTPRGVLISSLVATASPGSLLVDTDDTRRVMIFNVIDASDPDAFREDMDRFYNRFQRHAVP